MDNLPIGPLLAVLALLILWSALFTAIEAAQQHLLAQRTASRSGDRPVARLSFPLSSLILCNTLCRALVVVISTLLALFTWAENGPWAACLAASAALLVLEHAAQRRQQARRVFLFAVVQRQAFALHLGHAHQHRFGTGRWKVDQLLNQSRREADGAQPFKSR